MARINKAKGDIIYGENVTVNKNTHSDLFENDTKAQQKQHKSNLSGANKEKVFIIHGHNEAKWRELEHMLQGFGLEPIELSEQVDDGRTLIEKFEYYASQCVFAFALFTYDDIVTKNGESYLQVRPNVIFELGWFYAKIGRERVSILEQKTSNSTIFSDLQGIVRLQYMENVEEVYKKIQDQLKKAEIIE